MARLLVVSLVITAGVAAVGLLVAVLRDEPTHESVVLTLWIAGTIVLMLVGLGGSPGRNLVEGRSEIGGRMAGASLPETPLEYALVGLVLIVTGVVVHVLG